MSKIKVQAPPAVLVISDWLKCCQVGQWTPFEGAQAIIKRLNDAGYVIIRDRTDPEGGIPGRG